MTLVSVSALTPPANISPGLLPSLEGAEIARVISLTFFALFVYEWMITFDEEVELFWSGSWTASRVLFLLNRYIPPIIMLTALLDFFTPNPTPDFCRPSIQFGFIANIAALGVIQAILVLRVWYLFSDSRLVRNAILACFIISLILSCIFAFITAADLELLMVLNKVNIQGCRAARPGAFWRMFFPSLILHTILYLLTAIRAIKKRHILADAPVLKKLLRDGGFFYLVAFVSVGFTAVGSFLTEVPQINIPIVFSDYLIAINSIAVSRIMLSIQSLAARIGSETEWLLNNAELSRAGWRKNLRGKGLKGDIIIERWTVGKEDLEVHDINQSWDAKRSLARSPASFAALSGQGDWEESAWEMEMKKMGTDSIPVGTEGIGAKMRNGVMDISPSRKPLPRIPTPPPAALIPRTLEGGMGTMAPPTWGSGMGDGRTSPFAFVVPDGRTSPFNGLGVDNYNINSSYRGGRTTPMKMTKVGVYSDEAW